MAENNTDATPQATSEVATPLEHTKPATKLQIDRPTDFKFHLAYEVYSKAWDHNSLDSVRTKLNDLISSLANDENGYSDFYAQMQEYRRDAGGGGFRSGRFRIETSRKRDYQRTTTRNDRNRRHR